MRYLSGQIYCKFLRARLLNVINSAFIYNAQMTMRLLSSASTAEGSASYLKFILAETVANVDCFTNSYDKKLLVLGIGTLIMEQDIPSEVTELLTSLFDLMITVLSIPDQN